MKGHIRERSPGRWAIVIDIGSVPMYLINKQNFAH